MEYFDILSQRRTGRLSSAELTPAREILAGGGGESTAGGDDHAAA